MRNRPCLLSLRRLRNPSACPRAPHRGVGLDAPHSKLRPGVRWLLALLSLFPLLAPYELLLEVRWPSYAHPFFLLAALISAGAVVVSVLVFWAAVAGLSSRMVFDAARSTFTFTTRAPILRSRQSECPLSELERVEVTTWEWSDGAPSYSIRVVSRSGESFTSGASWSKDEVEAVRRRAAAILHCVERPGR